ncbi:MAG: PIN domain-containing protein [Candidatus Levybacteria bacterium]|nr:PIN domain-containing protein [Candidatus Levybacteria bacterium]
MNKPLIIDSSAFVSLGAVTDSNYENANKIGSLIRREDRSIIVPGDIFTETMNVVGKKIGHKAAIIQAKDILLDQRLNIVEITPQVRQNALEKFKKQAESVSFTDCIVMAFADEYETKEIFGFDDVFRKNGYIRIGIDKK